MNKVKVLLLFAMAFVISQLIGAEAKKHNAEEDNSQILAAAGQMTCAAR